MRALIVVLLILAGFLACDGDSPTTPGELVLQTLLRAPSSGFTAAERTAVRTSAEWAAVWETAHAGQRPVPARPPVDFASEMVILAAAGTRANGCYAIEITRGVVTSSGTPRFEVTETVPGPTCVCTLALTQPVHLVKVTRVRDRETFVEQRRELAC